MRAGLACLGVVLWLIAVSPVAAGNLALEGRTMGTTWVIRLPAAGTASTNELSAAVVARLQQLENQFSTYRPHSELSRFNSQLATNWIAVSPELATVGHAALEVSRLTRGTFDVTIDPVVRAYGFGPAEPVLRPAEARRHIGWQKFEVRTNSPAWRKADPQLTVDFSGIAKGYAADVVSDWLAGQGMTNHLVQIGGEVRARGRSGEGQSWRVGVQRPELEGLVIELTLALTDQSLSTSGNYHNTRVVNGRRVGHIMDPRTAEPVAGPLMGVSVVHASGMMADALAKGFFVLGPKEGLNLATQEHLAVLFLIRDGSIIRREMSPEFQKLVNR